MAKVDAPDFTAGFQLYYYNAVDRLAFAGVIEYIYANTFGSPPINTWMFIVGGFDASQSKYFISVNNGTIDYSSVATSDDISLPMIFGAVDDIFFPGYLNGLLDECGFWHRLLTSEEITTLYNDGTALTYPFIV